MNGGGVTEITIENYIQAINDGTLERRVDEVHLELARKLKVEFRPYTANEIVQNLRKTNSAHYNVNSALAWLEDWNIVKRTPRQICTTNGRSSYGWVLTFEPPRYVGKPKLPTKKELIERIVAQEDRIRELENENKILFEKAERFVCNRCKGTGYIEEQQAKFDI